MKFLIDEDMCPCLAVYLRPRGHDAEAICEKGRTDLVQCSDEAVIEKAAEEGRAVVTFNAEDYEDLHDAFLLTGRSHAGIVTSPQRGHRDFESVFAWMDALLGDIPVSEFRNRLHDLGVYASRGP